MTLSLDIEDCFSYKLNGVQDGEMIVHAIEEE